VGVVVDELIGIREVTPKPLNHRLAHLREFSGLAILGNDQIALILNAEALGQRALAAQGQTMSPRMAAALAPPRQRMEA
jgi:chemotaxis protein histidine kinase CheA